MDTNNKSEILQALTRLHDEIDRQVAVLTFLHGERLKCGRGCNSCCVDDLTIFEVEAENIRFHHADILENGEPGMVGNCPFLAAEGNCRIYSHRPYVCRTQGIPLRWIEEYEGGEDREEVLEYRDICPLNEEGEPIEELPEDACWTLGPIEGRLAALQIELGGNDLRRIALRELFRKRRE